jgi:DNA polymerase III subunit gamma/tau
MLTNNAFNALLKTLEEPPSHVKFIFATTEPHKVPITILSRCQRFDFKRIALPRIVARLRYIVDQEGVSISDEALAVVARKGDGSMRDALSTLDQVLAFCGESVADADVASLLGVVDRRLIMEASQAVFAGEVRGVLEIVSRVDSFGYSMRQFCQELIDQFRGIAIIQAVGDGTGLLELSEAELAELSALAKGQSAGELQRHLTLLLKAETEMAHASFPRLVLEMALMKMATLRPAVPVQELLKRLAALESGAPAAPRPQQAAAERPREAQPTPRPASAAPGTPPARPAAGHPAAGPASAPAPQAQAPAASAPALTADDGDLWVSLVRFVKGKRPMIGSELEQVYPVKVSRELLEIGCLAGSYELRRMQDPEKIAELKALVQAHFGGNPNVRVTVLDSVPSGAPPTLSEKKSLDDAERAATLRREAEAHPLVTAAVELFDGEIAEVKELKI